MNNNNFTISPVLKPDLKPFKFYSVTINNLSFYLATKEDSFPFLGQLIHENQKLKDTVKRLEILLEIQEENIDLLVINKLTRFQDKRDYKKYLKEKSK